jgi:hypothetical protein
MNRLRIVVLALLVPLLVPSPADAATRLTATGGFTQTSFTVTGSRTAGGLTFVSFEETDALTGTLSGTSQLVGECIFFPSGEGMCKAEEIFTGTLDGRSGTLTFHDVVTLDDTGAIQGRFMVVDGTGELAGVVGHGTFSGVGTAGTYSAALTVTR